MAYSKQNPGTGRPKGSTNKVTGQAREFFEQILQRNFHNIEDSLTYVQADNPAKYLDLILKMSEFAIPKLRSVDTTVDIGEETLNKIEVIIKK